MRLALVGATGRTGSRLMEIALARGHTIRALTRRPPQQGMAQEHVEWIEGNVLDLSAVARLASGSDAMLIALGPSDDAPPDLCTRGTATVISACRAFRISRLVVLTGAMIGHPRELMAMMLRTMWRTYTVVRPASAADRQNQEQLVMDSGLDWTLVRPPRLVEGDPTEGMRAGSHLFIGARGQATTGDIATVMLDAIDDDKWHRAGVTVLSSTEAEAEPDAAEGLFGTGPLPNVPIPVEVQWDIDDSESSEPAPALPDLPGPGSDPDELGEIDEIDEVVPEGDEIPEADERPAPSLADRQTPGVNTDSVDLLEAIVDDPQEE